MRMTMMFVSAATAALLAGAASAQEPEMGGPLGRDMDGDGFISRDEARQSAQKGFERLDSNGDGVVTLEEFQTISLGRFDQVDADGDDLLSRDELRNARPGNGRSRRGRGRDGNG
ncbi:MAG: hypothetical protein AAGI89_05775 [Pseudomonadota bacterium]